MIYDTLSHLGNYSCIPHVQEIVHFLAGPDISPPGQGTHLIRGKDVFLKKSRYCLNDSRNPPFEAHRRYADLQVVTEGREIIRTVFPPDATTISPYNEEEDIEFFSAEAKSVDFILQENRFLFLSPGEIHQPGCICGNYSGNVVKCVFKILYPAR